LRVIRICYGRYWSVINLGINPLPGRGEKTKKKKTSFHIELPFLKNSKNFLPNHQFFDSSSMKTIDSVMFLKYPK
jgi:hypothetical protein